MFAGPHCAGSRCTAVLSPGRNKAGVGPSDALELSFPKAPTIQAVSGNRFNFFLVTTRIMRLRGVWRRIVSLKGLRT